MATVYIFPPCDILGYENYGGWSLCLVLYKCIDCTIPVHLYIFESYFM